MMRTIYFILIISLLAFNSCKKETKEEVTDNLKFVPTDVSVQVKAYFTIDQVFSFINFFDHQVEFIKYGSYISNIPTDSLQYVLEAINAKPYTHDGVFCATGYINSSIHKIIVFPLLFQMKDKSYQADWLKTMEKFQLVEDNSSTDSGYVIYFHVPVGEEKNWVKKFMQYDFVERANLNYIILMTPY
jgi:hypothetical protein